MQGYFLLALFATFGLSNVVSSAPDSADSSPAVFQNYSTEPVSHLANKDSAKASRLQIGIISYWEVSSATWDDVPPGSTVVINPNSGVLQTDSNQPVEDSSAWKELVDRLKKRNVVVLGYVPTGYFTHMHCKKGPEPKCQTQQRIALQVKTYYQLIPSLSGIFYDETSPKEGGSTDYDHEYGLLRSINLPGHLTVFNVGWPSAEAVKATKPGEHLVLFESSPFKYEKDAELIGTLTRTAREGGIIVWHLIHSVCSEDLCSYVAKMAALRANYGYITNIGGDWEAGENTWGRLPRYWKRELAEFAAPSASCPAVE